MFSHYRGTLRALRLSLVTTLALCAFALPAAQADPPATGDSTLTWERTFGDEFDGLVLDPLKWGTCYWWVKNGGCTNSGNAELQWYTPANVSVGDGALKLRASKETVLAPDGKTYDYTSGLVSTGRDTSLLSSPPRYDYKYGYAEARAWVPKGKGLWSAFWMLPSSHTWPPETDVFEILGDKPTTAHMNVHYRDGNGQPAGYGSAWSGPDFTAGWHTFGIDWRPDAMVWYIDGVARHWTIDPAQIPAEPMYILANLAVGGTWPGSPDEATPFPSEMQLDYIRVWQRRPVTTTTTEPVAVADTTAPAVSITSPLTGASVKRSATVTIAAEAGDDVGVTKVLIYEGSTPICTDTTAPYSCSWKAPAKKASVQFTAKAYDAAGNAGTSAPVTLKVV